MPTSTSVTPADGRVIKGVKQVITVAAAIQLRPAHHLAL